LATTNSSANKANSSNCSKSAGVSVRGVF